ncbi:MAG: ComEA family DNA-binding protein [Mucilaginibacter sp.]
MKTSLKNYLSITKKEWNGLVILVVLIALVLAVPYAYQLFHKDTIIDFKDFGKAAARLSKAGPASGFDPDKERLKPGAGQVTRRKLAPFNPNQLTAIQWQQLGLTAQQAGIIEHYKDKGGRFYTSADLKKIYGITDSDYRRLEPYIVIPGHENRKLKPAEVIELNTADTAELTRLTGVGPATAVLIARYRGRLGGFYRKEQLKEIYGIDSARFGEIEKYVSVNPGKIRKISINTISFDQLRLFPYLSYKQVNAIIEYRKQHGNYTSIADMKNIVLLDDKILRKIEPYISFQ